MAVGGFSDGEEVLEAGGGGRLIVQRLVDRHRLRIDTRFRDRFEIARDAIARAGVDRAFGAFEGCGA